MLKLIKAFHGTTFRAYSLEIVKPQPTVSEVPKIILEEKPKTKWFRDPKTGYWVQVQKPTSQSLARIGVYGLRTVRLYKLSQKSAIKFYSELTWGVVGEFRKKLMFY